MRVSLPASALVAGSLVYRVASQASYGALDGVSGVVSSAGQANSPQGSVVATAAASDSNGVAQDSSCLVQSVQTVFITVYPASPASSETNAIVEPTGPNGMTSGATGQPQTAGALSLSPGNENQPTVVAFTTLTIPDLWNTISQSESIPSPSIDQAGSSPITAGQPLSEGSPSGIDDYKSTTSPTAGTAGASGSDGQGNINSAITMAVPSPTRITVYPSPTADGNNDASYAVVTDTIVGWITNLGGSTPATVLSVHTITVDSAPAEATLNNVSPVTCWTVTGTDGKETVIESPINTNHGAQGVGSSSAVATDVGTITFGPEAFTSAAQGQTPVTTITAPGPTAVYTDTGVIASTAITAIGPDGVPTVLHSIWVVQSAPATEALPNSISSPSAANQGSLQGPDVTSRTTFTVLGPDGQPTVVESALVIPASVILVTDLPQNLPNGITAAPTPLPPSQTWAPGSGSPSGLVTTCTSYTLLGPDGKLTVVETTYLASAPNGAQDATPTLPGIITGLPPVPTAGSLPSILQDQSNGVPQGTQSNPETPGAFTTSITIDVSGPNGVVTPVVETIVLTPIFSDQTGPTIPITTIGVPSLVPQASSDLPAGVTPSTAALNPITTAVTFTVLGWDGVPSSVVQSVVITPLAPTPTPSLSWILTAPWFTVIGSGTPPDVPSSWIEIMSSTTPSGSEPLLTSDSIGPSMPLPTVITGIDAVSVLSVVTAVPTFPSYGNQGVGGLPTSEPTSQAAPGGYGWPPVDASPVAYAILSSSSESATTLSPAVKTSVWVNVIPEPTTTYTLNFPLTTLASVTVPTRIPAARRAVRRQNSISPFAAWSNSSSVFTQPTLQASPTLTPQTSVSGPATAVCSSGPQAGNITLNFDAFKPGPLFNPAGDFWFSQGFLVVPISSQSLQAYTASSSKQFIEFVPPALTPLDSKSGSCDTAEIGVGPNARNPCFRFNLYSANLGCAASAAEQWCEFEVSAYTFNNAASNEMSAAWSEIKRVPACETFPSPACSLTPVTFEGYQNITSVLISLRVGGQLRAWWADDFAIGWTDSSCSAVQCRQSVAPLKLKRRTAKSAFRRDTWKWTPSGLERLHEDDVEESVH